MTNRTNPRCQARASPARSRCRFPPAARGGRSCIPAHVRVRGEPAAPSRRAASGFRTRCTTRSPTTRSTPSCLESSLVGFSQASARLFVVPSSLGLEMPDPERLRLPERQLGHRRGDDRETGRAVLEGAAATTTSTGTSSTRGGATRSRRRSASSRRSRSRSCPRSRTRRSCARVAASGRAHRLLVAYDRLLEGLDRAVHYHFELVNLGYGAYLAFYELCRQAFPDISDQTISMMVAGIDVVALRPDDELRRLARLARRPRRRRSDQGRAR